MDEPTKKLEPSVRLLNGQSNQDDLQSACEFVARELMNGVKHGFFEMTVAVETIQSKKRAITIKAGKIHRFVVPV